jgi:glyoxylate/hydroxypyruvate reductase A
MPERSALIFISEYSDTRGWQRQLAKYLPEIETRIWPDIGRKEDVVAALVWKHPHGVLRQFPKLKLIVNLGAGANFVLADPELPANVPIVRLVDQGLTRRITEYVALHTLALHRSVHELAVAQRAAEWRYLHPVDPVECCVGVMGLGNLGTSALQELGHFGFRRAGWSRTPKSLPGVTCFHGAAGLAPFLSDCNILICLLPGTAATEDLIDGKVLRLLPKGAAFINLGRGSIVVDEDLIAALDDGHIRHAVLDVFRTEPLPSEHAYWRHPKVTITPHNSSATNPSTAAQQVVANIRRVLAGEPPFNLVNPLIGY